jgi:cytochrome c biogenesis protein CcmG/thiol:disulfide interchange protein DsbE
MVRGVHRVPLMMGPVRRGRNRLIRASALAAVVVAGAACGAATESAEDEPAATPIGSSALSTSAPANAGDIAGRSQFADVAIENADGTPAAFADFVDGRPTVVNFFASWCAPCRAEMPDFQSVYTDVQTDVNFVGFALQDSPTAAAELADITGITYPWALDPGGELLVAFGGFAMPTTVYLSPDGEVVGTENGAITAEQLRNRVSDLFGVEA